METTTIIEKQKLYFSSGMTLHKKFRLEALKKLQTSIKDNIEEIYFAFKKDLNKCEFDVLSTEIFPIFQEISYMKKNLRKLMRPKRVGGGLMSFPAKGYKIYNPLGCVLVVSPWNYPLHLALLPLVGAIAAGNTCVLKPSSSAPNVSAVVKKILSVFDDDYICVLEGGREKFATLFEEKFDFIFFTGGANAGKRLMEQASKNLTPVLLELGGKCPCIIDKDADLNIAAKRVVWGKFLNAGQTCVAPDYVAVDSSVKAKFIQKVRLEIRKQFYDEGGLTQDFTHIINKERVEKLKAMIEKEKLVCGGAVKGRLIEPTVMDNVTFDDKVMQEEVFGPILPVVEYDKFSDLTSKLMALPNPLALYYFGNNKEHIDVIERELHFGGGCINDVVMHLVDWNLPFGGVGQSGIGQYHGKKSFEAFSHAKSVLKKGKFEISLKFQPYSKKKLKLLKKVVKIK